MNINKISEIFNIINDAISKVDISLKKGQSLEYEEKVQLFELLAQMKSRLNACRADFIEHIHFLNSSLEEHLEKIGDMRDQLLSDSGIHFKEGADNLIQFDRRRTIKDRRKLKTFIANDRRSGIADRRKKTFKRFAMLE